ncbi:MAG: TatD family hydrolase [Azovibrio sp.]
MWIDSHCHLDAPEFSEDRAAIWQQAQAAGVKTILIPAIGLDNCNDVDDCCTRYPGCLPAYGIHPMYVDNASTTDLERLEERLKTHPPVAIGEIGLDGYIPQTNRELQEFFFVEQLKLARKYQLPVILHVRQAIDPILKHLRRIQVPGGIAHAFNGSLQQAEVFIKLGFKLGFGGTLTYEGSRRIRSLAQNLPLENMVLETDAPDIPPSWLPRGRNTPDQLPRIGAVLAELRGISIEEIAHGTTANTLSVLGLKIEAPQTGI